MRKQLNALSQNEFFRNVATLMTGSTIAQLIALAIYPVLSDIYSPEEHGLFSLYMSIIAITGIMSTGRYQMAILMPKDDKKAMNLAALGVSFSIALSLLLLLMVIFLRSEISTLFKNENLERWLWYVPLSTFLIALFQVSIYWFNRHKNFRQTAAANLAQSLTNSGVKLSTSNAIQSGGGLIAGAIVGQIVGAFWFLVQWVRKFSSHFRDISFAGMRTVAKEYYRFPFFNLPNNLVNNISNALPVFLISTFFTAHQVGLYGLGFAMIFRPMGLVVNSMEQVFSQRIIKKFNDHLPVWKDVRLLLLRSFQIGVIPFLLAGIFGPFIFKTIFGAEWEESGRFMQLLIPWFFAAFMANQLTFLPDLFSKQKTYFLLNLLRFVLRIGGMSIGIIKDDIYLMLGMFSLVSFLIVVITLIWYVKMVKDYEAQGNDATSVIERPVDPNTEESSE